MTGESYLRLMSDRLPLLVTSNLPQLKPSLAPPSESITKTDNLDNFPWEAGTAFISYGLQIGIRVNDPDVLIGLLDYLPPGWEPSPLPVVDKLYSLIVGSGNQYHLLYDEEGELERTTELDGVLHALDSHLRLWIGASVQDLLFVHAGVVAWHNRAIVIPGRSFSGKTTLVAALVKAGATYYSDEYAVFDTNGLVHPYPRPLSVRQGKRDMPPARWRDRIRTCPVTELGGKSGTKPLSVGLILSAQYQSGAQWHPSLISPGEALLALLDNTIVARIRPQFALSILAVVVSDTLAIQAKRGEAQDVAVALLQQLEQWLIANS